MQFGVSSYSFSPLTANGTMDLLDVPAAAKAIGFDAIEFSAFTLPDNETPLSFAPRVREACDIAQLPVANYAIGADFLNGKNGDWRAEAERLKDEVRVAAILGAKRMRHDASRGFVAEQRGQKSFNAALPTLVQGCRAVTEFAADLGIQTMVENHGFFCQDSDRIEQLIDTVNHPNFGLLLDLGNFLCVDEDPACAVGRLLPYTSHIHAKDFHVKPGTMPNPGEGWFESRAGNYLRGAIIGHGDVPLAQCLRRIVRSGYAGELAIEFEGLEDPTRAVTIGLDNLRRLAGHALDT